LDDKTNKVAHQHQKYRYTHRVRAINGQESLLGYEKITSNYFISHSIISHKEHGSSSHLNTGDYGHKNIPVYCSGSELSEDVESDFTLVLRNLYLYLSKPSADQE